MTITSTEKDIATLAARFVNNTHRHVFLTGKAGTGKTTFLRYITSHTHKQAVIAAPTGVAAINAGGVTLHSLFQLPFGAYVPDTKLPAGLNQNINTRESLIRGLQIRGNKRRLLQELELLIIDEVSMLRADLLDAINTVLQVVRRQGNVPFGGVQVLFIGDLLQLPPVVKDQEWQVLQRYYNSPYFFDAQCLQGPHKPLYIELDKVYRQSDDKFIRLLNNLRHNQLLPQDAELLNRHYQPGFRPAPDDPYILLTTHNHKADTVNREALQKLPGKSYFFEADIDKDYPEHMFPLEATMELKAGAQVMFIKNDPTGEKRFYNGRIGKVAEINDNGFQVEFPDDMVKVKVEKYEWQNIRYRFNETTNEVEEEVLGTFRQYPVRLAWAITVHKSQGLTFRKAVLDLGGAFAPGQVYVALSRLVSLNGLVLSSPVPAVLPNQDQAITGFAGSAGQEPLEDVLATESQTYLKNSLQGCFDFGPCAGHLRLHLANYTKDEQRSTRQKHLLWAQELEAAFRKEKEVADKFGQQLAGLVAQQPLNLDQLETRIRAATDYFRPRLKELSRSVLTQAGKVAEEKKTKQYQAELRELESHLFRVQQQLEKAAALLTSFREGKEFTKQALPPTEERQQLLAENNLPPKSRSRAQRATEPKAPGEKKEKGQTQEESYKLYREGKSIEEIAALRGLAHTTIEGHLARYVQSGAIPVEQFLDPVKLEQILTVARTIDTDQLSPIKQLLGDEFSYTDIRFAVAFAKGLKSK
ncbi:helicase [Adhaeribacter aerolatus]|uniref:Helicase n=1 Tax=Adhaeribacter aerolatus TaxID=670289 RepID=A0A512B3N9_9BACT|nr:helix-turn-helix domain-containing protein [Adhaeribacter aerolatus]GEO06576.1 helicase [Adhaeribacter aerolatus]